VVAFENGSRIQDGSVHVFGGLKLSIAETTREENGHRMESIGEGEERKKG
jgi:hypothetical protein